MEKKVVPAILSNDIGEVRSLLKKVEGVFERVQIDIIDGKFADNKTIDPGVLNDFETPLKIDYHLMVEEPVNWVEKCARSSADRIIGHVEKMDNESIFVQKVETTGAKVGLGIDLATPIESIDEGLLKDLDAVLLMSVKAGFGGQEFNGNVFGKIEKLTEMREKDETPFKILVDGGVDPNISKELFQKGVDEVCVGKRLFEGELEENKQKYI